MPDPDIQLVAVLQTADLALTAIAKSLLDAEDIEYFVRGEGVQDLFALGRFGSGMNPVTGAPVFFVREEDAERARLLLKDLQESAEGSDDAREP